MNFSSEAILAEGHRVFTIELEAMKSVKDRLGEPFVRAVRLILNAKGNVIFSGVGKSGHVGRKLAATFASTGTTAYFVHADEAAHGDMGMIRPGDVFIGISFSGESAELQTITPALKALNVPIIAMTGRKESSLARSADVALVTPIEHEACPLNLAPTASTTITMALGDAIACALMVAKGFSAEDFGRSHPAGALGRRLLLKVRDIMRVEPLPVVWSDATAVEAIGALAASHLGCFIVIDSGKPIGIFTEGDLARAIREGRAFSGLKAKDIMTPHPKCVKASESAFAAMALIREHHINQLVALDDEGGLAGILHVHDLVAARVA